MGGETHLKGPGQEANDGGTEVNGNSGDSDGFSLRQDRLREEPREEAVGRGLDGLDSLAPG